MKEVATRRGLGRLFGLVLTVAHAAGEDRLITGVDHNSLAKVAAKKTNF